MCRGPIVAPGEALVAGGASERYGKTAAANAIDALAAKATGDEPRRPWYIRGGMHVTECGIGMNIIVVPAILLSTAPVSSTWLHPALTATRAFIALWVLQGIAAKLQGFRTICCIVLVPCYLTSLLVLPWTLSSAVLPTVVLSMWIGVWRVGICMSVCLHRYASHAAFKCGPVTQFLLNVLGCAAHQGGPIWWASQHRCHHKHCDGPRDPHSAVQEGVEKAFAFFQRRKHKAVKEEFAPKHNDNWYLRLLDTWSFVVSSVEMILAYKYFGRGGLFVSYTSIWLCQTITLWFNLVNHPPEAQPGKVCQAANFQGAKSLHGWYPTFVLLDLLMPSWAPFVSEKAHEDHHTHFMLAKRDKYDVMYHSFIMPLEKMGLLWDVKVASPE